jgi:hypothetical protein
MDNYLSSLFSTVFKRQPARPSEPDAPEPGPGRRSERISPSPAAARGEQAGYDRIDRTNMRQLIEGTSR